MVKYHYEKRRKHNIGNFDCRTQLIGQLETIFIVSKNLKILNHYQLY